MPIPGTRKQLNTKHYPSNNNNNAATANTTTSSSLSLRKFSNNNNYISLWRAWQWETKFFAFSVVMLLLSQAWLSHRHGLKMAMLSTASGSDSSSSVSRSLTAFRELSHEYSLKKRLHSTMSNRKTANADANSIMDVDDGVTAEMLENEIMEYFGQIPKWIKEYAIWHRKRMQQLDEYNWKNQKYLIMRCLKGDKGTCGDATHRLVSVASALVLANQSRRILLIKWTQPAALENYLVPPDPNEEEYAIDWRIPEWLMEKIGDLGNYPKFTAVQGKALQQAKDPGQVVVTMRPLTKDHGSRYFNSNRLLSQDPPFRLGYGQIWRLLFRPSPAVQSLLEKNMDALGLQPGSYFMTQVRTPPSDATKKQVTNLVKDSLECTKSLKNKQLPFLVASESQEVLNAAVSMPGEWHDHEVLALRTSENILSLDKNTEAWRERRMEDYYPAFVYLFMFANAKCVAYFDDDRGRWGSLISQNPLCVAKMNLIEKCERLDLTTVAPELMSSEPDLSVPGNSAVVSAANKALRDGGGARQKKLIVNRAYWEPIPEFPGWMNDYFAWHREQTEKLNESNWQSHRLLVMRCLATDEKCGGASDRLQSFLLGIKFAYMSRRILYIHWERPALLEEFLVPRKGSIDWRIPEWLNKQLDYENARKIVNIDYRAVLGPKRLVTMRHQHYWPNFWNNRRVDENERSFEDIFHDAWDHVFEPSLPVAALTEKTMRDLGIEKGKYVSVHVRAKYQFDYTRPKMLSKIVKNAINCASQLRPGWPIYFASDSGKAVKRALAYGKSVEGMVVAREDEEEPLHLDRGAEYLNHQKRFTGYSDLPASRYYDVFVDMELLANSDCISLGEGGYGRMASMRSFNRTCSVDYTTTKCAWTSGDALGDSGE